FATHCIEWQAVPQNSSVPVTCTMTCVPTVATSPRTMPSTSSASTDHFALGRVSPRQVRLMMPSPEAIGFPSAAWGAIDYREMLGNEALPGYGTKGHAIRRVPFRSGFLDHRAGDARSRVSGGLRRVVVRIAVDDETLADEIMGTAHERDTLQREAHAGVAITVGHERGHVAVVVRGTLRAMGFRVGIEVPAGAHAIARAAVALLVHVEAVLRAGLQARYVRIHAHGVAVLGEGDLAARLVALGGVEVGDRRRTPADAHLRATCHCEACARRENGPVHGAAGLRTSSRRTSWALPSSSRRPSPARRLRPA